MSIKKLILCLALFSAPCFATLQGGIHWDVRTTGSDSNGGGFDPTVSIPGADYSQQNSPQVTYADLTVAATTTHVTSAGNPFATCTSGVGYCGNLINVTSAVSGTCTAGWYEVLSTSTTTATLDRAPGTAGSVCNGVLGGSFATPGQPINTNLVVDKNTIWLKSGTYTVTADIVPTGNSRSYSVIGYSATHGDGGTANITTSTNSTTLIGGDPAAVFFGLRNLNLSNTAATPGVGVQISTNTIVSIVNCSLTGFSVAIQGSSNSSLMQVRESTITGSNIAINQVGGTLFLLDSVLSGMTGVAITMGGSGNPELVMDNTLVVNGSSAGINLSTANGMNASISHSTIANNSGDGIQLTGSSGGGLGHYFVAMDSTIVYGNGGWGVRAFGPTVAPAVTTYPAVYFHHNGWGSNTNGNYQNIAAGSGDVTLSGDPFTNSAGGDYSLNASAGAALKGNGYPGVFPNGTTTGYASIGAVDPLDCHGGGGSGGATACAFSWLKRPELPGRKSQDLPPVLSR